MIDRKVIAIDFDGTLFELGEFPEFGKPRWDIINRAKAEQANGAALILWTCRTDEDLADAIKACEAVGLQFDAINNSLPEWRTAFDNEPRKVGATEYWDDRAVSVRKDPLVDPRSRDFATVCLCAIRYALGQRTYMPSLVIGYITPLLSSFDDTTIDIIERDIVEQERYGGYGDDCDYAAWMRFLDSVRKEKTARRTRGRLF